MNLVRAAVVVGAFALLAVGAMLAVRRRAPDGGFYSDGDRTAGVFGVLATGFSVLLGFVVFLAFESYDQARVGAEAEARIVAQQYETAQFMPAAVRTRLQGGLTCYARSVIGSEWPRMESGVQGDRLNPWGVYLFRALRAAEPKTQVEQIAYAKWLDERSDRESARGDRIHGAEGVIPWPLWLILFLSGGMILVFMLVFADSGERAAVQALQIGSVAAVIAATLLVIGFLNNPFHTGPGGVRPVAMERTIRILAAEARIVGATGAVPCGVRGVQTLD